METHDRRVKRTQQLLAKALIALTLEKGYEAVTIRDITDYADVGYATFFRHYPSKDALLHDVSDVVLAELNAILSVSSNNMAIGESLFIYVREHANIIRVLLSSRGSSSLLQRIIEITTQDILKKNAPSEGSVVPVEIGAYHLVTSSIALIQWWLEHNMPYSPERMGIIYHTLIMEPTHAVAFNTHSPTK